MSRLSAALSALVLGVLASHCVEAAQRVFVASYGSDANTATGCAFANPCRGFTAAMTVVDPGGEVVALDAAGYGTVTITKSVTITANPGFYAGISASTGNGVTIATAAVNVVLRGLNINGIGTAGSGVSMTNGATLSIENCILSNFASATGYGVFVSTPAKVRVVDSVIRGNFAGVTAQGGASLDVATSKVVGNNLYGIVAEGAVATTLTTIVVSESTVAGNAFGIVARSAQGAIGDLRVSVIRSTISNTGVTGVVANSDSTGSVVLTLSESLVSNNQFGLIQAGVAVFESLGNNTVRQNTNPVGGTITTVPTI
jgi:hypothetical protein